MTNNIYIWKYKLDDFHTILYESNVDRGNYGEWSFTTDKFIWEHTAYCTFGTEEDLLSYVNKCYVDYLMNQENESFRNIFGNMTKRKAIIKFVKLLWSN